MNIDLDTYCSCSHCGKKAETNPSMGNNESILYPYETRHDFMLLCIECVKKELKKINEEIDSHDDTTHSGALLASFLNVYRKAFPLSNRSKN